MTVSKKCAGYVRERVPGIRNMQISKLRHINLAEFKETVQYELSKGRGTMTRLLARYCVSYSTMRKWVATIGMEGKVCTGSKIKPMHPIADRLRGMTIKEMDVLIKSIMMRHGSVSKYFAKKGLSYAVLDRILVSKGIWLDAYHKQLHVELLNPLAEKVLINHARTYYRNGIKGGCTNYIASKFKRTDPKWIRKCLSHYKIKLSDIQRSIKM
jgi:hypothetical protein